MFAWEHMKAASKKTVQNFFKTPDSKCVHFNAAWKQGKC